MSGSAPVKIGSATNALARASGLSQANTLPRASGMSQANTLPRASRRKACWGCGALAHMSARAARCDEPRPDLCDDCRTTPPAWMVASADFVAAHLEAA